MDFTLICPIGDHPFTYTWNGGKGRRPTYCSDTHQNLARRQRAATRTKTAGGKICGRCEQWKPMLDITSNGWCKKCMALYCADWKVRTGRRSTECRRRGCTEPKAEHPENRLQFCQKHLDSYTEDKWLLEAYGIMAEERDQRLASQGGGCAICGRTPNKQSFQVDHDHACCKGDHSCGNCLRGILCGRCNRLIAVVNDKVEILEAALAYLKQYTRAAPTSP